MSIMCCVAFFDLTQFQSLDINLQRYRTYRCTDKFIGTNTTHYKQCTFKRSVLHNAQKSTRGHLKSEKVAFKLMAQLVKRSLTEQEVASSIPIGSVFFAHVKKLSQFNIQFDKEGTSNLFVSQNPYLPHVVDPGCSGKSQADKGFAPV